MSRNEFQAALETELRRRGTRLRCDDLQEFVAHSWSLIADNPDPAIWADVFLLPRRLLRAGRRRSAG